MQNEYSDLQRAFYASFCNQFGFPPTETYTDKEMEQYLDQRRKEDKRGRSLFLQDA